MRISTLMMLVSAVALADAKFELENNTLKNAPVAFSGGSVKPDEASDASLKLVAEYLSEKSYISLMRIEVHVAAGTPKAAELTKQRALELGKRLIAKGVDCKRLIAVGFGDSKPASADAAANNRVLFVNAALRGHAIGGMPVDGSGMVAGDLCGAASAN